ncbi:peptidoglycan DD-metalloendopeptidase family protein [Bacteroidota bacterium]
MRNKKNIFLIITIPLLGFYSLFFLFNSFRFESEVHINNNYSAQNEYKIDYEYGIPVNFLNKVKGRVRPGQNLSSILSTYGISFLTIDKLNNETKGIFDVRTIMPGHNYYLFCSQDSLQTPRYFVYEKNLSQFIVFSLKDSINVKIFNKEVIKLRKTATGVISSSLWETMIENNLDPVLSIVLNDIYQWLIDPFGLQPGDKFRMIYEDTIVDGNSIGSEKIFAAQFIHMGISYYAIPFSEDSIENYYDEKGNSLRRAFLMAPLKVPRISSGYSNSRYHPILKIYRPHHGIDYVAQRGTPVYSVGDGTVIQMSYQNNGGGRYIKIKHNSIYSTTYMHLDSYASGIKTGIRVVQGQMVGRVGSTGLATGPHLDFRFYKYGNPINPQNVKAPPVKGISEENQEKFKIKCDSILRELEKIEF